MFGFLNRPQDATATDEVLARLQRRLPYLLAEATDDTRIDQLPLDSMDVVELLCATEDEFGVSLTTENYLRARTVRDLLRVIARQSRKAGHALR
jgi:acyl carrier protein